MENAENSGSATEREIRGLNVIDFVILTVVTLVTLLTTLIIRTEHIKRSKEQAERNAAARQLPISQFTHGFAAHVLNNREKQPEMKFGTPAENEINLPALFGWDATLPHKAEAPWKHFKTTVARTAETLEKCAVLRNKKLKRADWMPMREYALVVLPKKDGIRFAELYEEARFGPDEFSKNQATSMVNEMAAILQREYGSEIKALFSRK